MKHAHNNNIFSTTFIIVFEIPYNTHPPKEKKQTKEKEMLSYLPVCQQNHQLSAADLNDDKHNRDHNTTQQNNKNTGQVVHVKALCVASFGL